MSEELRVEQVNHPRVRPGSVRHWRGEELVAATCRVDGALVPAEDLVVDKKCSGRRRLICHEHASAHRAVYLVTPEVRARQKSRDAERVRSGRNAERLHRARIANPEKSRASARATRARRAARTDAEIAAVWAERYPDGLRACLAGCGQLLPLEEFHRDASKRDGLQRRCKPCHADAQRRRRTGHTLPSWEERGLYSCVYCSAPFDDVEHVIPRAHADRVPDLDLDDVGNLVPSCWQCNRGPGGKYDTPVLDWLDPDLLDLVADWPVEVRELAA